MALRNALNLLRNDDKQLQISRQHQRSPQNDKTNKVTQQVNNVFSLENTEKDIFDIDNDFFSDADILFSSFTDGEHASWDTGPNKALTSPPKSSGNSSLPTASNSRAAPDNERSPNTKRKHSEVVHQKTEVVQPSKVVSQPTRTDSPSPSPSSLVKLKSFTFMKQPSQERKGRRGDSASEPPSKKICSPSSEALEDDLFDDEILAGFTSDEAVDSTALTHHSSCTNRNTKTSFSQSTSSAADSTFRKPSSHLQRSTNLSGRVQDPSINMHNSHRTATQQTSTRVQKQQSNVVSTKALSQAFTVSTPSTLHTAPQDSGTSTPTVQSRQPASTPLSQTSSLHESSSSSTRTSSTAPPPPSVLSTPQLAPTSNRVRRKFPGPAGILPTLTAGQSLDGVVIPTPSLPAPSSTPRVKSLLVTPSRFLAHSSHPNNEDTTCDGDLLDFSQGPWVTMLQDLDMDDVYSAPLLKCTIARALKQASRQQLRNGKVTHLRALLKSIVPAGRNTSAVLKDPTGEILCTIHQSVVEEHKQELQPGAVIILRQVTVFSPAPRKYYLSITPDNIVTIYPSPITTTTTTVTAPQTRKTICLTEVEKRFMNISNTQPRQNTPNQQPPVSSVAALHQLCEDEFDSLMGDIEDF